MTDLGNETRMAVNVDGIEYAVDGMTEISGAQIRALAGLAPDDDVVIEGRGAQADRQISDSDVVPIPASGLFAFKRPHTNWGSKS